MADRVISIGMLRSGLSEDRPWLEHGGTAEVQPGALRVLVPADTMPEQIVGALHRIAAAVSRDPNVYGG